MFCPQCGASAEKGQRFCVQCGTALPFAPVTEEKKQQQTLDLSAYFDEPGQETPAPRQEMPRPNPVWEEEESEPAPRKGEKGLNIALLICGVLAVAVITFVLILLLWPSGDREPAPTTPTYEPAVVTAEPDADPTATEEASFVVVTPSPSPTPTATTAPTQTPSPTPDLAASYLLPDSNSRFLTEADLKNLTHEQLSLARNEIFARHGRIFTTPQIAAYFNGRTWYNGTVSADDFPWGELNKYEHANISFISEYEQKYFGGPYNY